DVNNLCGAPVFWQAARRAGLQPLLGAELLDRRRRARLLAIVADEIGYENLCRVITRIQCDDDFPLESRIGEFQEGLHFILPDLPLSACGFARALDRNRLWVGVDPAAQTASAVRAAQQFAHEHDLPLVATGSALLAAPADHDLARLLAAIRLGKTCDAVEPDRLPHPGAHLRAPDKLAGQVARFPAAAANNRRLVERCAEFQLLPRKAVFPRFDLPAGLRARDALRRCCREGMKRRYGEIPPPWAESRLETELRLIQRMGFAEYFLVVWDIVQYARRQGAPVAGRGSGASSIVAYVLGITNVCPIAYHIPFERFLHPQREDFPDLDVDFCWRIRDDVIDYAFRRWGPDRVAMVCTHNTFQPRSALRETAKAFGFSDEQISRGTELEQDPRIGQITRLSRRLVGLPHLLSVHPGGIVIGRKPIDHYVPIQPSAKGVTITQYDKDGVEAAGLVKLDLLGNRNLATVRYACDLIRRRRGRAIDIEALPPADPDTVAVLRAAGTVGCNQLESPAMRHLLKMMQPADTRDVMKVLALIRPGAASIGMKESFIRRHRGIDPVPAGHAQVDAVLRDTHGVMLYEDDVMLAAAAMLGGTLGEGDRFRKAVQKCRGDASRLRLSRDFLSRCADNGIDRDYARSMWVQMAKFNAYSFCRAHAASYALLSYAGAYLKTHYPLEFWTAALNNNQSMYHPRVYVNCARRDGVALRLPDANRSAAEFSIDEGALRVGLNLVEGLGPVGVADILEARARGAFESLTDFLMRTGIGEQEARSMVLCGAFDFTGRSRPNLMMELNLFHRIGPGRGERRGTALFSVAPTLPDPPGDYPWSRKFCDEFRILGISIRRHVLAVHRPLLAGRVDADSRDLSERVGAPIRIAGLLEARRTTQTDRRQTMMFLTLDDEHGLFEVTVFPDALRRTPHPLTHYGPYVVEGKVEDQYGAVTVTADSLHLLDTMTDTAMSVNSFNSWTVPS
ncbi:MAG TPA: hypothetical protein VMZ50_14055, partial [Phycisphaerae bacterium]|nr:hypothetical protein [Phycisphaerae bacterium]